MWAIKSVGDMETFSDEVLEATSLYTDVGSINFFRSERDVSSTGHEEDVELLPCGEDENMCTQHPEGGEGYYMYAAVLEEFGVQIPRNAFEMDVLKALNVVPSQIHYNIEPLLGPFLYFYGTKDVCKGTWVSISAHPGKRLFPPYA